MSESHWLHHSPLTIHHQNSAAPVRRGVSTEARVESRVEAAVGAAGTGDGGSYTGSTVGFTPEELLERRALALSLQAVSELELTALTAFHSLPSAAWITARMVYFLVSSFYESTICSEEGQMMRELIDLEPLWTVLDEQKSHIGVSAEVSVPVYFCFL